MRKFLILLKKEIKELVTPQMIIPLIIMVIVFASLGNLISKEREKFTQPQDLAVVDEDQSQTSEGIIQFLSSNNFIVQEFQEKNIENIFKESEETSFILFIPNGFEQGVKNIQPQKIEIYSRIKAFSLIATLESSNLNRVVSLVNENISNQFLLEKIPEVPASHIKNPVQAEEFVVIGERQSKVSVNEVMNFIRSQTVFIPVILFMVILMSAIMVATTVATEKENKTLETLLSSPINRRTIILAKLTGSGLIAIMFAGVYMIGFRSYMSGMMGDISGQISSAGIAGALSELGIAITPIGYVLLGISLFLSILCALAIAIILGILVEDVKGVQAVITPLMILILIPYLLTFFFDINSLSPALKYIVYAIPFSHSFQTAPNLMTHNYSLILFGILYQLFIFTILIIIASKIFSSDKVLTIKLKFKKKNPFKR